MSREGKATFDDPVRSSLNTVVEGKPISKIGEIFDAPSLIKELRLDCGVEEVAAALRWIDDDPRGDGDLSDALRSVLGGVSGLATTLVLKKLVQGVESRLFGKIRDFVYQPDKEAGHLSVDLWIETFTTEPSFTFRIEFQHWDVVCPQGFTIHERDDSSIANPFPGIDIDIPDADKDPAQPGNIWSRRLNRKIHARGKDVVVERVYRRVDKGPLVLLDKSHRLYQSTAESCVDLLLTDYPPAYFPPTVFGELPPQFNYCLGRCGHPNIVNTGSD